MLSIWLFSILLGQKTEVYSNTIYVTFKCAMQNGSGHSQLQNQKTIHDSG